MTYIRESAIEKHLIAEVKKAGGIAYKFVSPGRRGVPDRLVLLLLPDGKVLFVECKESPPFPAARKRPAQGARIHRGGTGQQKYGGYSMKLGNAKVLTFRHPNMGEVIAITNGGESIDDARYLVSLGRQPNEDWETQTLRAVIGYMAEDNRRLRKQVSRLTQEGGY